MTGPELTSSTFLDRGIVCPVLVGRQAALRSARTLLDRAAGGRGGIFLVAGEAGIGKSRMLREAAAEAKRCGYLVLQGACFEADRADPYAPLLDLVRSFASATSNALAAHALAPAAAELVRVFPELVPLFADLAPLESLDPEHERRRLFHALADTLAQLGRTQPVYIAIEDVHWCDEATMELLLHLARRVETQPIVMALSYRSDEVGAPLARMLADLDRTRVVSDLSLTRFSSDDLSTMVAAIFEGAPPGGAFVDQLHELTEGNPFFAEEVLKGLVATGDLARRADGKWHARPLERVQVPRTAVEAVRRRLAALTVSAREVASMAAVAGRRVDFALLYALTGHDEKTLLGHIKELVGAQLVTEESPDRFAFRHALTRAAIVHELLARERIALHRAIADALESHGALLDARVEALAYHAYEAHDWARALTALSHAADHALSLQAPREALSHLDRALAAAANAGVSPEAGLRLARARALETLGDFQGADADFRLALDEARRDGRTSDAWNALHALGMLWAARDYGRAGEYRREALTLAREIGDAVLIARSLNRVANWHLNLEQPRPALRYHAEALALFEGAGDAQGVAETVDLLGMAYFIAGDMATAAAHYERAIVLHESIGDRRRLANALALLCMCDASLHASATSFGRTEQASLVIQGDRPIRLARAIGWRAGESFTLYVLADALAWRGMYERALPFARESLAIAEEIEHLQWQCASSQVLGAIMLNLGDPTSARASLTRAHEIARRLASHSWLRWSASPLACAMAQLGEHDQAREILDAAMIPAPLGLDGDATDDDVAPTLGECYLEIGRAEVALCAGNAAEALAIADRRLAAESRASDSGVPRLTLIRGEALLALGDLAAAETALTRALEEAVASDARPLIWRVHAVLGRVHRQNRNRAAARASFDAARASAEALSECIPEEPLRASLLQWVDRIAPASRPPTARQAAKAARGGLTRRERDVARLVAEGKSNRVIARALGIGERTVEGYVAAALGKLGFTSRVQLAGWAVEHKSP